MFANNERREKRRSGVIIVTFTGPRSHVDIFGHASL